MIIRDCIHGDIYLDDIERRILDTPEMQRLRGIKQLGTSYLVYPSCTHTRFEHSLGTLAAAKAILAALEIRGHKLDPEAKREVTAAALVHDVTHIPFGHTFEDERKIFSRHDSPARLVEFLTSGTLSRVLRAASLQERVLKLLTHDLPAEDAWKGHVISSTIDADLLDYLRRDAYFAGLPQNYDNRIFSYFTIRDGQLCLDMTKHNMERQDARSEVMNLLRLRYFLTERVYFHHAKVISGAMIAKAVEIATDYGVTEKDFYRLNDNSLLDYLSQIPNPDRPDRKISNLVKRVLDRNLLKRGFVASGANLGRNQRLSLIDLYGHPHRQREKAEAELARALGIDDSEVILYCPGSSYFKEIEAITVTPHGLRKMNEPRLNPPLDIKALEDQYEALWRLYVFVPGEVAEKASHICEEYFGIRNEHFT